MVTVKSETKKTESNEEIEKRRPKPFRYITDTDEINKELSHILEKQTVMTNEQMTSEKLREQFETTLGIGDINVVEQVIKKHRQKRDTDHNIDIV